ncbi:MAG: M16 family metallopeptidase [Polyangiales bacterium]
MRLRFAALFALAVGLVEAPAASTTAKSAPSLAFERYVLPNGLEVILHEDHKTPIVAVNVWYHVGGKDEPQGKNGFAHLFEHVMFQGSKNVGEDMFFKYLERAGASDRNGTTSQDRTNYFETVPSNELALALWLESDRMGTLLDHANDETFKSQRDVVKNERRQNYENAPYGLVPQFIHNAMFPKDHPYHRLVIGTPEDLDAASFEDVKQFFRTWYVPNNATLVLAGDFEPLEAKALVAKYFGTLQKQPDPHPKTQPVPVTLEAEKRLNVEAEVELARVVIDWPTAAHFAPGDSDLDLVANVLSSGKTSRLYKRLVYDLQIAQDVYAQQESMLLGSNFEISVTVRKGKDPLEVLKIVDEELAKLRDTPVADDELARARTRMISTLIFSAERVTARADMLNAYAQEAHDPGYFTKDLARYESASAATLQAAAQRWLPAGKRVLVVVTPTKGAPRAGRLVEAK